MNQVEVSKPNFLEIPSDIRCHILRNLPLKKVFFVLPQVHRLCSGWLINYCQPFEGEENFWKQLCLERHTSWDGMKTELISKEPLLSWKLVYLASEPSYYIYKKRNYENKKAKYENKIKFENAWTLTGVFRTVKALVWGLNEKELAAEQKKASLIEKYNKKIELISKERVELSNEKIIAKLIVGIIGKDLFNKIPLFNDCLINNGYALSESLNNLIGYYINDTTFPRIVRGETNNGLKYLFLHPDRIFLHPDKIADESNGEHFTCICSMNNSIVDYNTTYFQYPNGGRGTMTVFTGTEIHTETLEILERLVKNGVYYNHRSHYSLELDFFKHVNS